MNKLKILSCYTKRMNKLKILNLFGSKQFTSYNGPSHPINYGIIATERVRYLGISSMFDCQGCNNKIKNKKEIQKYVYELCNLIDVKRNGDCRIKYFGEHDRFAGLSMIQFIETSLISGHFSDSTESAYIDIFSCKPYDTLKVLEFTKAFFEAKSSKMDVYYRY